jgi:glycosyltransferase involved in cell wall biosynthesis
MILHDIPTTFPMDEPYPMNGDFNITVVNTFSFDEPLDAVLDAAREMKGVRFYITGKVSRADPSLLNRVPANVRFTDFLSTEKYYSLMHTSQAVMCLTKRNHTMQRGACEALSMGKPIITSRWPLLQEYFSKGTVHVDNTSSEIRSAVYEMQAHYDRYLSEIQDLQVSQQTEWQKKAGELAALVRSALEA